MPRYIEERFAKRLFEAAIEQGKAAAVLECLWQGGSVTIDAMTGKVTLITADQLRGLAGEVR